LRAIDARCSIGGLFSEEKTMTIQVGDEIPFCTLKVMGEAGPADLSTDEIFGGKKVVLFAVPGAFTPGCSLIPLLVSQLMTLL
jgi:peroxiredoxin